MSIGFCTPGPFPADKNLPAAVAAGRSFAQSLLFEYPVQEREQPFLVFRGGVVRVAVGDSPALHCSTIGAGGLNFSVRNGKRWDPAAITT